jgi:hypothetical protein
MDVSVYLHARALYFRGENFRYLVDKMLGVSSLEVDVNRRIPAGAG